MIRNANKVKRMEHCKEWIAFSPDLEDMLFSDETSVALESNARYCNRKKGRVVNKPVPKHPAKIHVWGHNQGRARAYDHVQGNPGHRDVQA